MRDGNMNRKGKIMKTLTKVTVMAIATLCATAAASADYKVKRTLKLSAQATDVWHLIGDFCDIDDWHPDVRACSLKVRDGALIRVLTNVNGEERTQKRIAHEAGLSYTYKTVSSPLPVENFISTLSVESLENSLIAWSVNFSSDDPAMEQVVVDEIEAGLATIEKLIDAR